MRPLSMSNASSHSEIEEIATPSDLSAAPMARLAGLESRSRRSATRSINSRHLALNSVAGTLPILRPITGQIILTSWGAVNVGQPPRTESCPEARTEQFRFRSAGVLQALAGDPVKTVSGSF